MLNKKWKMDAMDSSSSVISRGSEDRNKIGRGSGLLIGLVIAILMVNPMVLQRDLISQTVVDGNLSQNVAGEISGIPSTFKTFYDSSGNYIAYEEGSSGFDSNGVILTNWQGIPSYYSNFIARYVVEIYNYCLSNNNWSTSLLNKIKNQTAWLHANESQFGDHSIWLIRSTNNYELDMNTPWWSVGTNVLVIAAMLDSYSLFGNQNDLVSAWRAMKAYSYSMQEHGIATNWNGTHWYEEYACNTTLATGHPQHFLNGMLYALQGLYYIFEFNGSSLARSLFDNGVDSIKVHMKEFDTGMWEKYSITNPRSDGGTLAIRISLFNWLSKTISDPDIFDWYNRTKWMWDLPLSGYTPARIDIISNGNQVTTGIENLTDKKLYDGFWVGQTPSTMIVDLGEDKPIGFVGYYSPFLFSAPINWTLYSKTNDSGDWKERAIMANSYEYDKAVVFKEPFSARYLRFEFRDSNAFNAVIAIDEIVISNPSSTNLSRASLSIEEKRFNCTYGRVQGNVYNWTLISIDGGEWFNSSGNYTVWLIAGSHHFSFNHNGKFTNKTIEVIYATTVRCDTVVDYSLLLVILSIAGGAISSLLIGIYSVRRYRRHISLKGQYIAKGLRRESFFGNIRKKDK
jgi:hypothetical protein